MQHFITMANGICPQSCRSSTQTIGAPFIMHCIARTGPCMRAYKKTQSTRKIRSMQSNASTNGLAASQILHGIHTETLFHKQLEVLPAFQQLLDFHMLLHDSINEQHALTPAATRVSDVQGVFVRHSKDGSSALRVQTLSSPSELIDWCHHTFAVAPGYCYSKSSVFTPDASLMPHLELEMGLTAGKEQLLMCIIMDPRLSLVMSPKYLEQYYTTAPPGLDKSWMQLDASAQASPGFTRFTSPSLHVRAFASSAILFNVSLDPASVAAAQQVLQDAVNIWLAWGQQQHQHATSSSSGDTAEPHQLEQQPDLHQRAAWSTAWRNFPRREAAAGLLKQAFGDQVMEDYWDSMAGAARVRTLEDSG